MQLMRRVATLTAENDYATKSPLITMERSKFTPKTVLPFDDHHPI